MAARTAITLRLLHLRIRFERESIPSQILRAGLVWVRHSTPALLLADALAVCATPFQSLCVIGGLDASAVGVNALSVAGFAARDQARTDAVGFRCVLVGVVITGWFELLAVDADLRGLWPQLSESSPIRNIRMILLIPIRGVHVMKITPPVSLVRVNAS